MTQHHNNARRQSKVPPAGRYLFDEQPMPTRQAALLIVALALAPWVAAAWLVRAVLG
jgi:hypothetical protein